MPRQIQIIVSYFILLYVASVAANIATTQHPQLETQKGLITLEDGTSIQWQQFNGVGTIRALKYIFTNSHVVVQCPKHKDFTVFTGASMPAVREAYTNKDRAWCGWDNLIGKSRNVCITPISPRDTTYVAVVKPKTWLSTDGAALECTMQRVEEFSMHRFVAASLGAFLFWSAPVLSESTPFRLTGGALGFALTSALIVVFLLSRTIPHKRSFLIGSTVFTGSVATLIRWVFGTWLPSLRQLLFNPIVATYFILSGLVGLAITYYYNDVTNQKMNTIFRVALQLVGLVALGSSATLREGSVLLIFSALASKLGEMFVNVRKHGPAAVVAPTAGAAGLEQEPPVSTPRAMAAVTAAAATNVVDALKQQFSPLSTAITSGGRVSVETIATTAAPAHPHVEAAAIPTWLAETTTTPTTMGGATSLYQQQQQQLTPPQVSPLVERGMILNEATGRLISIGKGTFNKLVKEGYQVDMLAGTMTPPMDSGKESNSGRKSSGVKGGRGSSGGRKNSS